MKKIKIKPCEFAELDHNEDKRIYCHTHHYKNTICTCRDFWRLPDKYFWGILLHEFGHILVGENGSEEDANKAALVVSGVVIHYAPRTQYGDNLEYVNEVKKVMDFFDQYYTALLF